MKTIELQTTKVFQKNFEEYQSKKHRVIINEGGTGSSKTVSLAQLFALILIKEKNIQATIARKTFPALRATAMKEFFNVIKKMGIYREEWHHKSEHTFWYLPTNSEIDFISLDEPIKVRSRRRNYLWMNEANEFTKDDYMQLAMRTDKQIFMDYNPSYQFHWIYDDLQTQDNCVVITSTYKDNPFLAPEIVKEIESYHDKDPNYWRIYGLGLKAASEVLIYTHWKFCDKLPDNPDKILYGLDFGFNNPTALVKIAIKDKEYYWQELLYEKYLTTNDLIKKLSQFEIGSKQIFADSSEPDRIKELQLAGFNVIGSYKGKIKDGIDIIKSRAFYITKDSVNLLKEVKSYSWQEKNGRKTDEPVKENDHLLDAGRYAIVSDMKVGKIIFE